MESEPAVNRTRYMRKIIAILLLTLLAPSCFGQVVLGKHPLDTVIKEFYALGTNADSTFIGLTDNGSSAVRSNFVYSLGLALGTFGGTVTNGRSIWIDSTNNSLTWSANYSWFALDTNAPGWLFSGTNSGGAVLWKPLIGDLHRNLVTTNDLSGTPDGTKFLRDDLSWQAINLPFQLLSAA